MKKTILLCALAAGTQPLAASITSPTKVSEEQELFTASAEGYLLTVNKLLKKVSPNIKDQYGNTPLHFAANVFVAKLLIDAGANVKAKNTFGLTPLHYQVLRGHLETIALLLDNKADVNAKDENGITPLHIATFITYFDNPEKILNVAMGVTTGAVAATTALYLTLRVLVTWKAVSYGGVPIAFPLKPHAIKYIMQTMGITASQFLAIAAAKAIEIDILVRNDIVERLLTAGANPNAQDKDGNTPLHILATGVIDKALHRHAGFIMAEHLILNGALRTIKNKDGKTPYDIAKEYRRVLLYPILQPTRTRPIEREVKRALKTAKKKMSSLKLGQEPLRVERYDN